MFMETDPRPIYYNVGIFDAALRGYAVVTLPFFAPRAKRDNAQGDHLFGLFAYCAFAL